jgi:hypothetical protein
MKKTPPPKEAPSEEKGWVKAYGLWFPPRKITNPNTKRLEIRPKPMWLIEKQFFMACMGDKRFPKPLRDSEGPKTHFIGFVNEIWNWDGSPVPFLWTPLALQMLDDFLAYSFCACAGHASSGKSHMAAIWSLVQYLMDPDNTKVFVTSTSLEESKQRIWGVIERYWHAASAFFQAQGFPMPGKLVSSRGMIKGKLEGEYSHLVGLALLAGGKGQDKKATSKIGFKATRMFLVADELPLLTEEFNNVAIGNLSSNKNIHMIGIGNPLSYYDPFGKFAEPRDGWKSIDEHAGFWLTKLGCCRRFDGHKSPNVIEKREIWPNLLTYEQVEKYKKDHGEDSMEYWRMVRGFWSPTGAVNAIYTEREISDFGADQKVGTWVDVPRKLAFLDPAFSHGGDRAVATLAVCGKYENKSVNRVQKVLELREQVDLMKKIKPGEDVSIRLAELYIEQCEKWGVAVNDRGVDATGGGDPFASLLATKMGQNFIRVSFAGGPSERTISRSDNRKGTQRFINKVTELWYVGKELIRGGNIRGLNQPDCVSELCARTYKQADKEKVQVETKDKMKSRAGGKSPDYGDSFVGVVEVARINCGLSSDERTMKVERRISQEDRDFSQFNEKHRPAMKMPQLKGNGPSWGLTSSFKRAQMFGMHSR